VIASITVLARSITLFLLPSATSFLRQPAWVTKLVRTIRPFTNAIIAILWIVIRVFYSGHLDSKGQELSWSNAACSTTTSSSSSSSNSSSENTSCSFEYFKPTQYGLFDLLQLYFQSVSNHLVNFARDDGTNSTTIVNYIKAKMVSNICLYLNDFLGIVLVVTLVRYCQKLRHYSLQEWKDDSIQCIFAFANKYIPVVRNGLLKEEEKMEVALKKSLWKHRGEVTKVLPKEGKNIQDLLNDLKNKSTMENETWQKGFVSGAVYGGDKKHTDLLNQVYSLYSLSNPLHPDIWPSITQCEAEVISMTANLLNGGDKNVVGSMTSGGTESIIMAVRAHLRLYGEDRGIEYPEIISGHTAHAGLNKACEMFGIRLVQIPCGESTGYRLDPNQVERYMNSNVIMIYSSAPCYPQGVIDPIDELSSIALKYDIGLHVDACLGGFILPFAKMMNYEIPDYDFTCPGVTSISADTHKYGYASKGTSVVLYRNKTLRRAQFFNYAKWSGGLYSTPTIAGSRAGALIACAWVSLLSIGENGFKNRVKQIMDATTDIASRVANINGLKLLGCDTRPQVMIVCFTSEKGYNLNIYQVAEYMNSRGWNLNSLQNPSSIHLCVTLNTVGHEEQFVTDLKNVVNQLLSNPPEKMEGSSAAIYGATGSMPPGPVNELLKVYTDVTLSC